MLLLKNHRTYSIMTKIDAVWRQTLIPVIHRQTGKGQKLRVRLPFAQDNRRWLQVSGRVSPEWVVAEKHWELPKAWFNDLVDRALEKYGKVYVIQPYREQEKCSPACQNAIGHECQCSCMGRYHGAGNDGSWFEVSDTFSTRWSDEELACRLMTAK